MSLQLSWTEREAPIKALAGVVDGDALLQAMQEVLTANFTPAEVFGESELHHFVSNQYAPEEVFSDGDLRQWTEENGFVREEA